MGRKIDLQTLIQEVTADREVNTPATSKVISHLVAACQTHNIASNQPILVGYQHILESVLKNWTAVVVVIHREPLFVDANGEGRFPDTDGAGIGDVGGQQGVILVVGGKISTLPVNITVTSLYSKSEIKILLNLSFPKGIVRQSACLSFPRQSYHSDHNEQC